MAATAALIALPAGLELASRSRLGRFLVITTRAAGIRAPPRPDRRVLGSYIVNSLVKNQSNKTAVHDVWTIGTTMLYDIAIVVLRLACSDRRSG